MLSKKENFMRIVNGEMPESIPVYSLGWSRNGPSIFRQGRNPDGTGFDYFGVEWYMGEGIVPAALPKPGVFILDDITKWRDVIKVPDFANSFDWSIMGKQARDNWDPELPFGGSTAPSVGFFEGIMSFMGFDEGLIALYEEPEEVKALLDYLCTWSCDLAKLYIEHYKPDFGYLGDDIAHERNPFVSVEMFQELFAPYWKRYYDVFLEAGIPVGNHNCGFFEPLLPDLVGMGCTFWDPVQSTNDIPRIKEQFGRQIAMCTAFEMRFFSDDVTEEQVRTEYREYLNRNAPGGAFALLEYVPPNPNVPSLYSQVELQRRAWVNEEFEALRYTFYK
jgi:uroporphyrinogen-III decarboxylase